MQSSLPVKAETLDRATVDQYVDSVLNAMNEHPLQRGKPRIERESFLVELFVPKMRTPVSDLLVSNEGDILLRGNDWARRDVEQIMIAKDGKVIGRFRIPAAQLVKAFDRKRIWSVRQNDDGEWELILQPLTFQQTTDR
jgi:hypothetical protein